MLKVDLRNKVGVIVPAVLKIVLGNHTVKNVYGNVNYAKTFIQGTIVNVFDGPVPGKKNEQHNNQHKDQHDNQYGTWARLTKSPACRACGW
jgi:hypothetical protein